MIDYYCRPDPANNAKKFVDWSDILPGGGYPIQFSANELYQLIVVRYKQTNALCTVAAAEEVRRKKRGTGIILEANEKALSSELVQALLRDPAM